MSYLDAPKMLDVGSPGRIGVVDLRRSAERVSLRCTLCDIGTDFPLYGELANWTGRAFLFAHEHREKGHVLPAGDVAVALAQVDNAILVPRQQGWPVAEFNPFLAEQLVNKERASYRLRPKL